MEWNEAFSRQRRNVRRPDESAGIQVIARAAAVLRTLRDDNSGLSLGQIAERTSLPRSTVQRIINALADESLVMMTQSSAGYRLGPEIQSLAQSARIDVAEVLRPILKEAARMTGETVDLAIMRNNMMIFVDQVVGSHRLRTVSAIGDTFPMGTTANGKAALALSDDATIEKILASEFHGDAERITRVLRQIADIRNGAHATDEDEHTDGISAIGTAFRTHGGQIYAVSIAMPTQRYSGSRPSADAALSHALRQIEKIGLSGRPGRPDEAAR